MSDVCSFGDTSRVSENIGGISEWQLKIFCLTQDGDFLARNAESKRRLPQLFWVHSAWSATLSASAIQLLGFGRISKGYFHRCSFSRFFNRLLNLPRFGTLGERRPSAYCSGRKKWSSTVMEFVDYENEILKNWFQINHNDVSKRVRSATNAMRL